MRREYHNIISDNRLCLIQRIRRSGGRRQTGHAHIIRDYSRPAGTHHVAYNGDDALKRSRSKAGPRTPGRHDAGKRWVAGLP